MEEVYKIIIGTGVLILGIPIGFLLAKATKEELASGRIWFKLIVIFSLIGGIAALILKEDVLLFSLLFVAVVTGMSLRKKR